ncbi:hypothetical protein BH10ACT1_BH10ACT1_31270 [soil metagenome]
MDRPPLARRAPMLVRGMVLACVLALLGALCATPSAAQDPSASSAASTAPDKDDPEAAKALAETLELAPASEPASPDDAFVAVVEARKVKADTAGAVLEATRAAAAAGGRAIAAAEAKEKARKREALARATTQGAEAHLEKERDLLSQLTVRAYVSGDDASIEEYRALVRGDTTDPARGRTIMFEQVLHRQEEVTDEVAREARAARRDLNAARTTLAARKDAAATTLLAASTRAREQQDAEQADAEAGADLVRAVGRLRSGSIGGAVPEGVAIIGLPRLSAEDLAGWFASTSYQPRVATPIADYARWFIAEGNAEGIRGDIAFAQAVLETGGFANNDSVAANNFSGIGHCDLCPSGWRFATPELGVRAQIQLLKSYAVRKPQYASPLVDKRLRGPAGCCSTWGDLTTVWATDPGYGPKVMLIYTAMVSYALQRRAAGQGLEDPIP